MTKRKIVLLILLIPAIGILVAAVVVDAIVSKMPASAGGALPTVDSILEYAGYLIATPIFVLNCWEWGWLREREEALAE